MTRSHSILLICGLKIQYGLRPQSTDPYIGRIYMAMYMAIYGQCFIFVWPYFGHIFTNFLTGVSEARVGGRAGRQAGPRSHQ